MSCCTEDIWEALATDSDGTYSCGSRITWLQSNRGYDESEACAIVSLEFRKLKNVCSWFGDHVLAFLTHHVLLRFLNIQQLIHVFVILHHAELLLPQSSLRQQLLVVLVLPQSVMAAHGIMD